jgi:cytochrome c-type biogenesis protein CcmF
MPDIGLLTATEMIDNASRIYDASGQAMTEAAIAPRLTGDLYASLGEPVSANGDIDGAWGVRIYLKPFIDWIWGGALMMALGGDIAIADRRDRIAVRARETARAAAAPA